MISAKARRAQKLKHFYEAARKSKETRRFYADLREEFNDPSCTLSDYSVRELAENFISDGAEFVRNYCKPESEGGMRFTEAADAVDTSAFSNIMGQWSYSAVLQGYNMPTLCGDQLVTIIPTEFNGERVPGLGRIGDDVEIVAEGNPYPTATFGEEWVDTPETIKRGLILDFTKEAIFYDRTGRMLANAQSLGERVSVNREKRILDVACGIVSVYRRNGGQAEATYQSDNTVTTTPLVDWTSIDAMNQKFADITDPTTGEPIMVEADTLWGPKTLDVTAKRVMNATMVRVASNTNNQTYTNGNQLENSFRWVSGQYVKNRTSSATTWFGGQPKKAFAYMQNWPLAVTPAPENNQANFERDIISRFKVSERGAVAVLERRFVCKLTA